MLYFSLIIVLSIISSVSLLCLESTPNYNNHNRLKITPLPISDRHENLETTDAAQLNTPSEAEVAEMELVLESSPIEAQCIIKHLQDPTYFPGNEDYRSALFVGEPGSGKTTTAKAIAYNMSKHGWESKFLSSTSLIGTYRNQTALHLHQELEATASLHKPTIIIIDELNRLLEHTDSKHHDTDATATALWTFLDKHSNNKNIFFIGTMNRANKLPKPFKDRIIFDYIQFPLITDTGTKRNIIRKNLTIKKINLDLEVTDEFLCKELERMGSCSGRNLKKIAGTMCRMQKISDPNATSPLIIKKASIIKAINEYVRRKEELQYDIEDETDEQRQERHHAESINLQNKHHEEQMLMQEKHFVQQQMIQLDMAPYQESVANFGIATLSVIERRQKIESLISDEQKKLYEDIMLNTRIRETKEAAIAKNRSGQMN